MSDNSNNNDGKDDQNLVDHVHSFAEGAVTGATMYGVFNFAEAHNLGTLETVGYAVLAGVGTGAVIGLVKGALGIEFKEKVVTNAVGIGAAIAAGQLIFGEIGGDDHSAVFNHESGAQIVELAAVEIQNAQPIAMIGDEPLYIPE